VQRSLSWPTDVPQPLSAPPLTNAPSDGPAVISWIERHAVCGEGDRWGEPVRLETFEKLFLIWLFERRPDGRRRYRRALLEVPKGNGKTSIAAWVGAYQLATQHSAVIPVAAASFEQAGLLFDDMRTCISESPTLSRVMACFENEIQLVDGPGRAYRVAAIAGTNDHDLDAFQPAAAGASALVALYRGDWAHAKAAAHDVLTQPGISPMNRAMPLLTVALIRARRGQQPVTPLLDEAHAGVEPVDLFRLGALWVARAEAAWLHGDDNTARAEAQTGLAAAPATGADPWLVGHLRRWLHLSGGPPASIPADDPVTPYRLEISGDWRAAADAWTALGCPYDAALAQLGGDIPAVKEALATFRRLGARAAARRARQRLAQTRGLTPHPRRADTRADPHGLTRRERDVLELLARGHRDADIASILCISPKTVGKHVSAILTKLGVQNRTQAAAYAPRSQTTP
jgi:DNA-binding CsgD family transcriptional regulator